MLERSLSWLATIVLLTAIFVGGVEPAASGMFWEPWDKLAHLGCYLALTLLLLHCCPQPWWLGPLFAVLLGALDELNQLALSGRQASVLDWLADVSGVVLALFVHQLAIRSHGLFADRHSRRATE